jgi:4'-phosphopantetheinyl transferase
MSSSDEKTALAQGEGARGADDGGRVQDVFVYWTTVPSDLDVSLLLPRLDPAERQRAGRFHFARDRNAFAVAHALLRYGLDVIGGRHPWRFGLTSSGKPFIDDAVLPGLHFNLSHSHAMTAVAISRDGPLGVDVEVVTPPRDREDIAPLVFDPVERALLQSGAPEQRQETFFTLWTLKEATIKATGQGLSADLPGFAFVLDPPRLRTPGPDGSPAEGWRFFSSPIADCRLAAALRVEPGTRVVFHLSEVVVADLIPDITKG